LLPSRDCIAAYPGDFAQARWKNTLNSFRGRPRPDPGADIGQRGVILVAEEDHEVNPVGVKGSGELGNVGMAAAVTNAIDHTAGIRELPVRLEKLLMA
jgi:hypothetical protein